MARHSCGTRYVPPIHLDFNTDKAHFDACGSVARTRFKTPQAAAKSYLRWMIADPDIKTGLAAFIAGSKELKVFSSMFDNIFVCIETLEELTSAEKWLSFLLQLFFSERNHEQFDLVRMLIARSDSWLIDVCDIPAEKVLYLRGRKHNRGYEATVPIQNIRLP